MSLLAAAQPDDAELAAWLRLVHTDGLGPTRGRALLARFGEPAAIFTAHPDDLAAAAGSPALAAALISPHPARDAAVAAALAWRGPRRRLLVLGDSAYPGRLLDGADPPLLLYCHGDPAVLAQPQIAIVGSRNATALGARSAAALAAALAGRGLVVTSGLAEGIDRAAHVGALAAAGGRTVAVVGAGVDRIYPARHRLLADSIAAAGALLSEYPLGMPPLAGNFPRRNRLIAALVHAVVVVEATVRSGSLITARLAAEIGREVLAVPGSIHSPLARGCHVLLRNGAGLVESADDVLAALPHLVRISSECSLTAKATSNGQISDPSAIDPASARLLASIAGDPVAAEALASHHGRPLASVLASLQALELAGSVRRERDGRYVRTG
ncbi:MAG: DNA-processing protein DprA [Lautropia sp.]